MSQLQAIAARLRALAQDASPISTNVQSSARQLKSLGQQVEALSRSGINTGPLLAALQQAQATAQSAADGAARVRSEGVGWANHLAKGGGSGASGASTTASGESLSAVSTPGGALANSPDNEALVEALSTMGLELEAVENFDWSDNPILGYRDSGPPDDIAYAVKMWDEQIAPGIATGATRQDFADYDDTHGLQGHMRLSGVYDYLLGGDAIWSRDRRSNGKWDPGGGRHRLAQARLMGVPFLPVRRGTRR